MPTGMELVNAIREERSDPPSGIRTLEVDRTHNWLTRVEPGHVEMVWSVEDRYQNLEGAVIAPWTMTLADQALFFASNTLCGAGEGTRLERLAFALVRNINVGVELHIVATIDVRVDDWMRGRCDFLVGQDLMAYATAEIRIIDAT